MSTIPREYVLKGFPYQRWASPIISITGKKVSSLKFKVKVQSELMAAEVVVALNGNFGVGGVRGSTNAKAISRCELFTRLPLAWRSRKTGNPRKARVTN